MSSIQPLTRSLIWSAVLCLPLLALVGYILNKYLGSILLVSVAGSGFVEMMLLSKHNFGPLPLLLFMLVLGVVWALYAYLLLEEQISILALAAPMASGAFLFLLKAATVIAKGPLVLNLTLLLAGLAGGFVIFKYPDKMRRAIPILIGWHAFCGLFWIGHLIAGPVGLLTITVPATLLFWSALLIGAGWFVLPIDADEEAPVTIQTRLQAIKSVLTFILNTNYPYVALLDRETVTRVDGSRFNALFAGPGIILTGPDHAAAIWTGYDFKRVGTPGLSFTGPFECIRESLDLRPQLRAFKVEATTKDGIPVSVLTFVPHRLDPDLKTSCPELQLGASFPYDEDNIAKVLQHETVEYQRVGQGPQQSESRERGTWDTLVPRKAEEILTNILAEYTFDELCAPFDRTRDPRTEIRTRFIDTLTEDVAPWGIEVIGGGISNINPPFKGAWSSDTVWRTRIENWRIAWARRMLEELGHGEARATEAYYQRKAEIYAIYTERLNRELARSEAREDLKSNALAQRIADAVQDMLGNQLVRRALPSDVVDTLDHVSQTVRSDHTGADTDV
jgi:hypothetical protein